MSTVAEKLAELNATNTFSFEPASVIAVTVKNEAEVEVSTQQGEKKKFSIRFPLAELPNLLNSLRNVDKIVNPRPPRSNNRRRKGGEKAEAVASEAATTEEGAEVKKSKRRRRNRGKRSKRGASADGDAKSAAESSAAIVLDEEAPKKRREKRERKPRRDPDAPDTRIPIDTKATIRNLNYLCTEEEFRTLLTSRNIESKAVDWRVRGGKSGRFAGFCHVEFNTKAECDTAIAALDQLEFQPEGRKGANKPFLIAANYKEVVRE